MGRTRSVDRACSSVTLYGSLLVGAAIRVKIGFKVDRIGWYRLFGPLVDEALRQRHEVVLLHRDYATDRSGLKAYQWADPARVPTFRHGTPVVHRWRTARELVYLGRSQRIDALVTIWSYFDPGPCEELQADGVVWVALQESHEFHVFPVEMLLRPDRMCMFSEWWIDVVRRYYPDADAAAVRARLVATGWPELDSFALVDRAHVRSRLGAGDRPIVTLASYKQHRDDSWEQIAFRDALRPRAAARALLALRPELLHWISAGVTYDELLRSLRAFCDRNGALLVSKARMKDDPPLTERRLADISLFDQSYYPATVVELASVSQVFVNFMSTSTLEAVHGGAYVLVPMPPDVSEWMRSPVSRRFREVVGWRDEGSLWNYPGVVEQLPIADVIRDLPDRALNDIRPDPWARASYVERFLGGEVGHAARTLAAIEDAVGQRWRRER